MKTTAFLYKVDSNGKLLQKLLRSKYSILQWLIWVGRWCWRPNDYTLLLRKLLIVCVHIARTGSVLCWINMMFHLGVVTWRRLNYLFWKYILFIFSYMSIYMFYVIFLNISWVNETICSYIILNVWVYFIHPDNICMKFVCISI